MIVFKHINTTCSAELRNKSCLCVWFLFSRPYFILNALVCFKIIYVKFQTKNYWSLLLVAEELNNTHIKLALFRLLFTNKWVTYPDKLPIY